MLGHGYHVRVWDAQTGKLTFKRTGAHEATGSCAWTWSEDGRFLIGANCRQLEVWDVATKSRRDVIPIHGYPMHVVARGSKIYVCNADHTIAVYEHRP